jgi:aminoglycoside phosphotransferase (APT) family kinase protein
MARMRMHAEEVLTDAQLVRRLLADQFPHWADLAVVPVESSGTDHDIYRLGDTLAARLPRIGWATGQAAKEARWLPRLAPALPVAVPRHVAHGRPGAGYPFEWSVCSWLPGRPADRSADTVAAAVDVAGFVNALRAVDTAGAPARAPGSRGGPLAHADDGVRAAIAQLADCFGDRFDADAALRIWDDALAAPTWTGPERWLHGDLLPGNLLMADGRLTGVIDFGTLNVGDPACDLQPAWNLFTGAARERFLAELGTDDASRRRGRGWVVRQTTVALPYYRDTNPGMVRQASYALDQVLAEAM